MIQCVHCATPVPDDARFCQTCGTPVPHGERQMVEGDSFEDLEQLLRRDTQGEFEIHRMLGRGGMAVVYLATETHLRRQVAIKVLPPELTFGQGADRFKREAQTAAALDHPHIIPVYRIASGRRLFWYAMKFLEGRSLEDLLRERHRLPLSETAAILRQVAEALDYAHQHKVIHRDVKPANVMLDAQNRVIVTDFGIAKALTEQTLTASGSVVGTPAYMSPEQGLGKGVSGRSDQYAVAVMAFRMLSGQVPFEGHSAIDILHKHVTTPPPQLEGLVPDLPPHVYSAVHQALQKNPEARFPTVGAFVQALAGQRPLHAGTPASAQAATVVVPSSGRPSSAGVRQAVPRAKRAPAADVQRHRLEQRGRRRSRWRVVAASLGLAALASGTLAAWWLYQRRPPAVAVNEAVQRDSSASGVAGPPQRSTPASQPHRSPPPTRLARSRPTTRTGETATLPTAVASARAAAPARSDKGMVFVRRLPWRHALFVDGQPLPRARVELPPGPHEVRVRSPGRPEFDIQVTVVPGRATLVTYGEQATQTLDVPPQRLAAPSGGDAGLLLMRVEPAADVTIGGVHLGNRRLVVDTLGPGPQLLHVERQGFLSKDTTITLQAGRIVRILIRMVPKP